MVSLVWPNDCKEPARLLYSWNFPSKNTKVGCHFLSRASSWCRDWTLFFCISCVAGGFLYCWTIGEANMLCYAKSLQSCLTLCDPTDGSPPGSAIPGILQARTLEWVALTFSNAWKWKVKVKLLSHARLLATPWTTAYQAPPSMGFSRQEYWSLDLRLCLHAKFLQSCPSLCDPMDYSPPGSSVHGILQARILEWVAITFSNAWKWKVKVKSLSRVWLLGTPWTAAHQAPLSRGFSRQEY